MMKTLSLLRFLSPQVLGEGPESLEKVRVASFRWQEAEPQSRCELKRTRHLQARRSAASAVSDQDSRTTSPEDSRRREDARFSTPL